MKQKVTIKPIATDITALSPRLYTIYSSMQSVRTDMSSRHNQMLKISTCASLLCQPTAGWGLQVSKVTSASWALHVEWGETDACAALSRGAVDDEHTLVSVLFNAPCSDINAV